MNEQEPIYYAQELDAAFKYLNFFVISDIHKGHPQFSEHKLDEILDIIANVPNAYYALNGDLVEAVTKGSVGDIWALKGTVQKCWNYIVDKFRPVAGKCLAITRGNHENRIYDYTGVDICAEVGDRLAEEGGKAIPYDPDGIALKISFGDGSNSTKGRPYVYTNYITHGYGSARTSGAKVMKLERLASWLNVDNFFMSHDHTENIAPLAYLDFDPRTHIDSKTGLRVGRFRNKCKILIKTGAYMKWGGWAKAQGMSPTILGTPQVIFYGEGKPRANVLLFPDKRFCDAVQ